MAAAANVSHSRILLGLVLGALVGSLVNFYTTPPAPAEPSAEQREAFSAVAGAAALPEAVAVKRAAWVEWVVRYVAKPVGDLFMNLLFLAIIPLVFASLALGVTRLGGSANVGRIGAKTFAYFIVTTAFAAAIGLYLVNAVRPGDRMPPKQREEMLAHYAKEAKGKLDAKSDFGIDTFVNIVPKNPLKAFAEKDMLAVIFTAILVGIALTQIDPTRAVVLIHFLEGVNQITEFVIGLAMRLAPVGVFALIFSTTALFGYKLLLALGAFVFTVLGGLAIHLVIVLPLLVGLLGGMNPLHFFRRISTTLVTAFSTSSSSATLPTAIRNAEELGVPTPIAHFVLPLSASMNHNGTALFESVTVLFLAQVFGVDLSLEQQIIVLVLSILTATGMAGVPGGSLPLIGMVLATATHDKVPASAIALILGVDRILDMCRTTVNVAADMTTAVFVARTERGRVEFAKPCDPGATRRPLEPEA